MASSSLRRPASFAGALFAVSAVAVGAVGCDTPPVPDAGTDVPMIRDAGPPPPPYTCEGDPTIIDGVLGTTESVTFDTTMTDERPRDLGVRCGNGTGEGIRWARQEVVEYRVPGTGPVSVEFSTLNAATATNLNTVIQVRESCDVVPDQSFPPTCLDDATATDPRSRGAYQATGGDTLYFIVTGYSDPPAVDMQLDEGVIQVDFTPRANTPPTITTATAIVNGPAMVLSAEATDAEGPIFGFALQLFTATGQIDLEGDGDTDDQDVIPFGWEVVTGEGPYVGSSTITPEADGYRLADYCRAVGCTEAGIAVFDAQFAPSAFLRIPITEAELAGNGEPCDGVVNVCANGLSCVSAVCQINAAVAAACAASTLIDIEEPVDATPTTATVMGTLGRGTGNFSSPCSGGPDPVANSIGREAIYRIEIENPGTYRLDLTTALPGTGDRDTIMYVRGADCWDSRPPASLGCNDDVGGGPLGSAVSLELTEGTYHVYVEFFNGVMVTSAAYELSATLTLLP